MVNIKDFIKKLRKNPSKAEIKDEQLINVEYLTKCINNFANQLDAQEECAMLFQQLSNMPGNQIVNDTIIMQFKEIISSVIEKQMQDEMLSLEVLDFKRTAKLYNNYSSAVLEPDGSYSISPVITNEKLIDYAQQYFLTNPNGNITESLSEENKLTYDKLLHSRINTYYGTHLFIKDRANCIMDSMKMISNIYQLSPMEYQLLEIKLFEAEQLMEKINGVGEQLVIRDSHRVTANQTKLTQDEYFNVVVPAFKQMLEIEEELSFISQRIWENYFSQRGAKFVHALSGEIIESDKMQKICATLYLDDLATIPYGHTGYEYEVSMENIDCICECDAGSWLITKSKFLEYGISHTWQWNEETCMFYEEGYYSKLLPPDYVETKARERNVGEKDISYTEILLLNNKKKIKPVKAFCTEMASQSEIEEISKMAEQQGIELEYIDTMSVKNKMNNRMIG